MYSQVLLPPEKPGVLGIMRIVGDPLRGLFFSHPMTDGMSLWMEHVVAKGEERRYYPVV